MIKVFVSFLYFWSLLQGNKESLTFHLANLAQRLKFDMLFLSKEENFKGNHSIKHT